MNGRVGEQNAKRRKMLQNAPKMEVKYEHSYTFPVPRQYMNTNRIVLELQWFFASANLNLHHFYTNSHIEPELSMIIKLKSPPDQIPVGICAYIRLVSLTTTLVTENIIRLIRQEDNPACYHSAASSYLANMAYSDPELQQNLLHGFSLSSVPAHGELHIPDIPLASWQAEGSTIFCEY